MVEIVLTPEQADLIRASTGAVRLRDETGTYLGTVRRDFTEEDFAIARRRLAAPGPRKTTTDIKSFLTSLSNDASSE